MKHLLILPVLLLSLLIGNPAFAPEFSKGNAAKLSDIQLLAMSNFHQEITDCIAYYSITVEGLKRRDAEEAAAQTQMVIDSFYMLLNVVSQVIGIKEEAVSARLRMSLEQQMREMGESYVNLSILLEKYALPCKAVIENPSARQEFWMDKAAAELNP